MAPKTTTKTDAIRLMSTETNFERSGISGQQCTSDATPRQEEMPKEIHQELLAAIARDEVVYIVFSYRTPIAWAYRNGAVNLPEVKYSKTMSMHQNWVREAFGDRVNRPGDFGSEAPEADAPENVLDLASLQNEARRYCELGEDDLIGLLAGMAETFAGHLKGIPADMAALALALKARRDETAPARKRIGEYLRHQGIVEQKYRRDTAEGVSDYTRRNAIAPKEVVDELRADAYAGTAKLRLDDLKSVAEPTVRDSKHEFEMNQATLLSALGDVKISEKQAALLPCVAKGHITRYCNFGDYSGKNGCTCSRLDGRTVNALLKRDFIGSRRGLGYNPSYTLMLISPKTA